MPSPLVKVVAARVPVLKRLPVFKLLTLGEVALLAREHLQKLTPAERRRLVTLVRVGRGRSRNLTLAEREELATLVAKAQVRRFAGAVVSKVSPVPLPRRLVEGRSAR